MGLSKWSLYLSLSHQNLVYHTPLLIRVTSPAHLILIDFMTQKILGKEYESLTLILLMWRIG
jgi:hypothetical protein